MIGKDCILKIQYYEMHCMRLVNILVMKSNTLLQNNVASGL